MRYLVFLAGVDNRDKGKLDEKVKALGCEGLKYIFYRRVCNYSY